MSAETSKAVAYIIGKGWAHKLTGTQVQVQECPVCHDNGGHFYVSYENGKDGVWNCFKCSEHGNLYQLREICGDRMNNVTSMQDVAMATRQPGALPDVEGAHRKLLAEASNPEVVSSALDYLINRGFTTEIIEKYKLGLVEDFGKRWLLIPYFTHGSLVFAKFRTLPPHEKDFRAVPGREVPLFNQDALTSGMDDLVICEGEADTLACLSKGITRVVGVPGAAIKKAGWIQQLDDMAPKVIYLLYDNDKVGQEQAKEIGARIGLERVKNILLPEFTWVDEEGEEHKGKDINEWFRAGHTLEDFEQLKTDARAFNVDGIHSVSEVVDEIREQLANGGTLEPKWKLSPWDTLNRKLPGAEQGDLIGLLAPEKIGKTSFALNILDFLNCEYNEPALMFCQEMQPKRLVRKWMCMVTDTDDKDISLATVDAALAIAADRKADFLFGYTTTLKRKDVFETIRQAVRRYGVKFVCFDNLQLLCRSLENTAQEISATTKEFKQLAMELGIVIILIMQPHAMKEGEIVSSRNVYGSSAPGKDVDSMICLHRNREGKISEQEFTAMGFMEVEESYAPEMLVRVDLSRYSAGGTTTLLFDGGKSKVLEFTGQQIEQKKSLMPVDPTTFVHPPQFQAA